MPNKKLNLVLLAFVTVVLYNTIGTVPGTTWFFVHLLATACAGSTALAFVLFRQTPAKKETEELLRAKLARYDAMHSKTLAMHEKLEASVELVEATKQLLDAQIANLLVQEKDKMLYDFLKHKFEVGHTPAAQKIIDRLQTS